MNNNRFGPMMLAFMVGLIGSVLALTSLAHNLEGVLPRITAQPGTLQFAIQLTMEAGATIGLNLVALFGFTFASIAWSRKLPVSASALIVVALMSMIWSGVTQLGVIADKGFAVSGSKQTEKQNYERAKVEYARFKDLLPMSYKFMDDAQADLQTDIAALKSHKYGKRTAWQTTNNCTGDITAPKSIELCKNYRKSQKGLAKAKKASEINQKMSELSKVIAKGPPAIIAAGPQLVSDATGGYLTVLGVQKIKAAIRSFGIDLAAGLFLAFASKLWPAKSQTPPRPVVSREKTKKVIEKIKEQAKSEHRTRNTKTGNAERERRLMQFLIKVGNGNNFKTNHREIARNTGIGLGRVREQLDILEQKGLIAVDVTGRGTVGKIYNANLV